MKFFNSLTKKQEEFKPINPPSVGLYTCGPTVYDYAHIGHGIKYVHDDILKRTLQYLGYQVKHVMNITDVGHLVSDADTGEDKLEKGAKKFRKTVWEVAEFFTEQFFESMDKLNIERPDVIAKVTEHIDEQIEMIKTLIKRGYAYETDEAVYFDVSKFKDYGKLFGQKLEEKEVAVREEINTGEYKKNPFDFVLWFKRVGHFKDHVMHWESPWGEGFPGWHIECSAISLKYLGEQFDIHTGGIDHLPIHHPNEIAQSEAFTGKKPFVRYWLHYEFITVDGKKMSKSLGNFYTVSDIEEKGYDPLDLRYFYLTASYRKPINFTFEALNAAKTSREKLVALMKEWRREFRGEVDINFTVDDEFKKRFTQALEDDMNTAEALSIVWEVTKSNLNTPTKFATILDFDKVLGLKLEDILEQPESEVEISSEIQNILDERQKARDSKDWKKSDELRDLLKEKFGMVVKDTKDGQEIVKS
jgi:cysteinyl-tRNA synthetase